jgi:type II secretion system protein D
MSTRQRADTDGAGLGGVGRGNGVPHPAGPWGRWGRSLCIAAMGLGLTAPSVDLLAQAIGGARTTGRAGLSTEARQYRSNTMLGDAIIQIDPETRSLVIITDEVTHEEIARVVTNLDRPKPQVLIKVLFLEVTHRDELDVGVEGNYTYTHGGINSGTVGTAWGLAELTSGGFWSLVAEDWQMTLKALAERGKLEVLSRPSILARNNQEAVIVVGQEIPLITNSRITDQNAVINTVQYAEIGIILRVTPFITSEGMIEMIVNPEISTLTDQEIPISDTVGSPVIAKRSAETVVVTADGQTVVIGGLMQTRKAEVVRKVPILGDVPLLGWAFKRKQLAREKTELLIFLTPYIVNTPRDLGVLSRRETANLELAPKAFPGRTIAPYLDQLELGPIEPGEEGWPEPVE